MNKEQYLSKLQKMLPEYESQEIINDFKEHFITGLAEGKTEQEIIESLGDPVEIAKEYGYVEKTVVKSPIGGRIVALIGLIFFDLLIGIAIIASLFSVWISLWSVVISLIAGGIAAIVGTFFGLGPWYVTIPGGISVLALAVMSGIGMVYVSKYAFKALIWYGKLHVRVASGE